MATTSFSISNNQLIGRRFSAVLHSPGHRTLRNQLRFSASYTTAERTCQAARQTASLYQVLGVQTGATCQEIKSAYRKLARVLHPDVASDGPEDDTSAAEKFMRVHAAYATLSDPEKRMAYDSSLFRQRRRTAGPSCNGYSELTRRGQTWETDQCW
ncbi:hypothetical protein ACP275_14G313900 [Erythranthe tilingii]